MTQEERKKILTAVKNDKDSVTRTGHPVQFKGEKKLFDVHRISLDALIYNKYNGRIAARARSHEKSHGPINPEKLEDKKLIEKFLWESKKDKNKATRESLIREQQNRAGIVTNDGIIIDGNRRAMLLSDIYDKREDIRDHNVDFAQYFEAVILPAADPREINKLETEFQMGEDEKVDYDAIAKYLQCKKLKEEYDFTENDIAEMMREDTSKIKEWLSTMKLMDEYLEYLGDDYVGIYTRLEKREDQFLTVNTAMRNFKSMRTGATDWDYDENDVQDLKFVLFDYIRATYEGKEFRVISRKSDDSFFCHEDIWEGFKESHKRVRETSEKEKTVDDYKADNPGMDLEGLLEKRDNDWGSDVKNTLKNSINHHSDLLANLRSASKPQDLIEKALSAIESVDFNALQEVYNDSIRSSLKKIQSKCYKYIKELD